VKIYIKKDLILEQEQDYQVPLLQQELPLRLLFQLQACRSESL
jgi:hypothetical protein